MSGLPRPYVLAEVTWKQVKGTDYEVALLPWGAIESHNYHLPYGTDVILTEFMAMEAGRLAWENGAKIIVLPPVPFGVNTGQLDLKLTINMNPSTQAAVLEDVAGSLAGQGIPKLVVLNGHGGNDFRQMLRQLQPTYPKLFMSCLNWYQVVEPSAYFAAGDHAGEMETSVMLHAAPDLVRPLSEAGKGMARSFKIQGLREKWAWAPRDWTQVTDDTGVGDPCGATAAKGALYARLVADKIATFLTELAGADPSDLYE